MSVSSRKPSKLSDVYQGLSKKLSKAVVDYLDAPDEDRTHDLRVAIRRFRMLARQLPKKERGKELQRYLNRCEKFLTLSTDLRDLDVIRDRLGRYRENEAVPAMLRDLSRKRRKLVKGSIKTARRLRASRLPRRAFWNTSEVWSQLKGSLAEFDVDLPRRLSFVLRSEKNVKALHQLKKEVRKYRYLLELLPQTEGRTKACDSLRQLQDKLGEIRDSDVVIDYLARAGSSREVRKLSQAQKEFRSARYADLVSSHSKGMGNGGQSMLEVAGLHIRVAPAIKAT